MLIGFFLEYKGHKDTIEFDPNNKIYYGKLLNIDDSVNYKAETIIDLHEQYYAAVNDYIRLTKTKV